MNRPLTIILLTVGVVLAGLNIMQLLDRQTLRERVAALESSSDTGALRGKSPQASPRTEIASRSSSRKAPGSPRDRDLENKKADSPRGEGFNKIASQWAKMLESPAMKRPMLAQMEGQLGPALADLYAHFGLEGQDLTHFKGLLAEQWLAQQQVGMKMMSAVGDPEKNAAIKADLRKVRESTEENVREFLNDDEDFAYFKNYRRELPDRMELDQFATALTAEGLTLSDDQKGHMLTAMREERVAS